MTTGARRTAGEGSITRYTTSRGETLWSIRYWAPQPDGTQKRVQTRGFPTKRSAATALVEVRTAIKAGTLVTIKSGTVADYLDQWLDSLRLKPSTVAYYRKNVRLHIVPHIGDTPLDSVTGQGLTALYRRLEASGRRDKSGHGGPLSPRTVRGIHDILNRAFRVAVHEGLLARNPADRANPPTATQARAPEIHPWTASQIHAFLDWCERSGDDLQPAWLVLLATGLRRGELLGLRWSDIDRDSGTISVRRSVTAIRQHGLPERIEVGTTKGGSARVIDIDGHTMQFLANYRAARAETSLSLATPDAYVFGGLDGGPHHPDRFSRKFVTRVNACRAAQTADAERVAAERGSTVDLSRVVPRVRLHDLRHASATLALQRGIHPKVVQERLGHATIGITLDIYSHVTQTMQRDAADQLGALLHRGVEA